MISLIITIIVIIGITSRFYLKFNPVKSFTVLMAAIIGLITAFSYYEAAASIIISTGFLAQWAQGLVFWLIYIIVSVAIEASTDYIVGSNIDFGKPVKVITALICGVLTGIIFSGAIDISIALCPLGQKSPYSRFGDVVNVNNPSNSIIPCDSIVTGIYNIAATGSLSSKNRFDVVHANFLDQVHLNGYSVKKGASITAGKDAVFVEKFGVQKEELTDEKTYTVVELNIKNKPLDKGGDKNKGNKIVFTMAQTRMICSAAGSAEMTGQNIKVIYPTSLSAKGIEPKENYDLSEPITLGKDAISDSGKGSVAKVELAFDVPANYTPMILGYKSNNLINLPKVTTKEEEEAAKAEQANNPENTESPEPGQN